MTAYELNKNMWDAIFNPLFVQVGNVLERNRAKCEYEYPWGVCNQPAVVSSIDTGTDYCKKHAREI